MFNISPVPKSFDPSLLKKLQRLATAKNCTPNELLSQWIEQETLPPEDATPILSTLAEDPLANELTKQFAPFKHLLQILIEHVNIGILLQGPQAEIILSNHIALGLLGLTEDQLLGKTAFDPEWNVVREDGSNFPGPEHPVPTALRTKKPVHNVLMGVYRPQIQDRVWLSVDAIPELNPDGSIHYVVCSFRDVTAYRLTEKQYQQKHALLSGIMDTSIAAVTVVSPAGEITYANEQAEQILGLSRNQIECRTYDDPGWRSTALDGGPWPDEKQPFVRVMTTGMPVFGVEHAIEWPDGRRKLLSINGAPIKDEQGQIINTVFFVHDITAQRQAEEALIQTQKTESLGVLTGGIAHDFNNLLMGMLGQNSLALRKLAEDHSARRNIEKAVKAAERAAALTKQLLTYSGQATFTIEAVNLNDLIKENHHLFQVAMPSKVKLLANLDEQLPPIEADAVQMQQLIMNLIINAAEAIEKPEGAVHIRTSFVHNPQEISAESTWQSSFTNGLIPTLPSILFEVEDNGSGMDHDTLIRIFDPFFTTKFTGRGLGLAAVLGIMRGHKGCLQVKSVVGQGTTFRIYLPITQE